jgi:hypothetical protein
MFKIQVRLRGTNDWMWVSWNGPLRISGIVWRALYLRAHDRAAWSTKGETTADDTELTSIANQLLKSGFEVRVWHNKTYNNYTGE